MTPSTPTPLLLLLVASLVAPTAASTEPTSEAPAYTGCYRLAWGSWSPEADHAAIARYLPPEVIELSAEGGRDLARPGRVIPHKDPSTRLQWAHWEEVARGQVAIIWSTGISGVMLLLRDDAGGLRGNAKVWFDDGAAFEATAVASSERCEADREETGPGP